MRFLYIIKFDVGMLSGFSGSKSGLTPIKFDFFGGHPCYLCDHVVFEILSIVNQNESEVGASRHGIFQQLIL